MKGTVPQGEIQKRTDQEIPVNLFAEVRPDVTGEVRTARFLSPPA